MIDWLSSSQVMATRFTSARGDVGFLVPYDGHPGNLSTLLRWDEFTRNGDLIRAKHLLFLMDACYSGLAVTRAAPPGSLRFVRDMMIRPTRLVLAAGKANEPVADSGGPLPHHSIFTGHLLQALGGAAEDTSGKPNCERHHRLRLWRCKQRCGLAANPSLWLHSRRWRYGFQTDKF